MYDVNRTPATSNRKLDCKTRVILCVVKRVYFARVLNLLSSNVAGTNAGEIREFNPADAVLHVRAAKSISYVQVYAVL